MEQETGIYLFQGNSLAVPSSLPEEALQEALPREAVEGLFDPMDTFAIPSVNSGGILRGAMLREGEILPPGWRLVPVREALGALPGMADGSGPLGRLLRAFHIAQWRRDSVYCGSCGGKNRDARSGELARECPLCGRLEFPRISPAVITLITNQEGDALLAHNRKFAPGVYSLIAGFNEAGEDLESTVIREVREEVNLELTDIRYIRSQPWPFPNSLMLGFSARCAGGELRPDGMEIEDARWFSREALPLLPGKGSVSRYLINLWLERSL